MGIFDFLSNLFPGKKKTAKHAAKDGRKPAARSAGEGKKKQKSAKATLKIKKATAKKKKIKPPKVEGGDAIKLKKVKGKKKARQVTAAPIDEESLGFGIELDKENEGAKKRKAFRISVNGLKVRCARLGGLLEAIDISASGVGFKFEKPRIKGGAVIKVDIVYQNEIKAEKVTCKVMRHEKGLVGCMFVDLDRHQDDIIHELVVIGQKEQADRRRKQKDKDWQSKD